ncbi:L-type lectin-domain containing receptor kinase IV.1 [Zea mays]|uniref:non-specific serine/threonine protein kinase n=1 Tax=Zea mays TaxID=4577 RepID=A0A317Y9V0_MAIZE|nr:L-type lectin-domain containing receptor kinase IV.1 [Zea mays]
MAAVVTVAVRVMVPVLLLAPAPAAAAVEFTFTGFARENVTTSGAAATSSGGLLQLTNATNWVLGHGFYPSPLRFKDAASGAPLSFSTTFVAAILPRYPDAHGHGLAFALAPSAAGPGLAVAGKYLGLFNTSDNAGNGTTSEVVAVELDTALDVEFDDINDNHVGVDVHTLRSVASKPAGYVDAATGGSVDVALASGRLLQVWIEYDGATTRLEVTVSPAGVGVPRPRVPLVSCEVDLSSAVADQTYVGFSAANGAASSSHYVLGWSFRLGGGRAPDLDLSKLPRPPPPSGGHKKATELPLLLTLIILVVVVLLVVSAAVTVLVVWRRRRFTEEQEDWEVEYGPHRVSYKDLYAATRGFRDVIGVGGFGVVYRGVHPRPGGVEVAVKKVSHDSRQGLREFVSEIASMSRLRHRNLVQLLGYCRRRGELLLVYDYMVNGSLDRHLFGAGNEPALSWEQRAKIVRDVAAGLLYLHEGWEQVVVHRDIKASNVLLDADMNGRLSDFGLARLYDHGSESRTTRVIGTLGYLAPEMIKTGKATPSADVFAFGAFLLEVACGRRPMESLGNNGDPAGLVDSVLERWKAGRIKDARDPRIGMCDEDDLELVLKLGLLCSHPDPRCRPSMRQVVQILEGAASLPATPPEDLGGAGGRIFGHYETFDEFVNVFPTTFDITTVTTPSPCSPSSAERQQLISA